VIALAFVLVLAARPTPVETPRTAGDYINAFSIAMDAEQYAAAEKIAREGQGRFPNALGFHLLIGTALLGRDKPADAFYELEWELLRDGAQRPPGEAAGEKARKILEIGRGTDVDEVRSVMSALQQLDSDPEAAVKAIQHVRERRKAFVLDVHLAEALSRAGHDAEAIAEFRDVLAQDAFFVPAYVELSELLKKSGKTAEASTLRQKARQLDADHPIFKELP